MEASLRLIAAVAVVLIYSISLASAKIGEVCTSPIYCNGTLLHTVQMARLQADSKSFVDYSLRKKPEEVLKAFDDLMTTTGDKPSKDQIRTFVQANFQNGTEFETWEPEDWTPDPAFLAKIESPELNTWARELHAFWFKLGRKVKADVGLNPELYSMIPVTHPVIVPGGRFREFFYWDSYWIQIGLLYSEMYQTVEGMLQNFLDMVDMYGFVPNGGRIYFTRSQPPLLIPMVKNYVDALRELGNNTNEYLEAVLPKLHDEFKWWLEKRSVTVPKNGKAYTLCRYNSQQNLPRPESYWEDYELAHYLSDKDKEQLYYDLHSGAESGWDFSSRWWVSPANVSGNLTYTSTTSIIPADLNGFLYKNAILMNEFYTQIGSVLQAEFYRKKAEEFAAAIDAVLWDEAMGSWFDYELESQNLRKDFYISNIVPLWAGLHQQDEAKVKKIVAYLRDSGALKFVGGVPTSMKHTGEQWDFPNGWAPLQHFIVDALDKTPVAEAKAIAYDIVHAWVGLNFKAYHQAEKKMFEKYDVTSDGLPGGGGEYEVVIGFGWSNGVILDFLYRYGDQLKFGSSAGNHLSPLTSTTITVGSISVLMACFWGANHIRKKYCTQKGHCCGGSEGSKTRRHAFPNCYRPAATLPSNEAYTDAAALAYPLEQLLLNPETTEVADLRKTKPALINNSDPSED